jgi:hypothetical protein
MSRQADSDQPAAKGKHQKMLPELFKEQDDLTPWQRFERLASVVFSVRKDEIDAHKPIRPRKPKSG